MKKLIFTLAIALLFSVKLYSQTCVASFTYYQYQGYTYHFIENATSGDQEHYQWIYGDGITQDTTGHNVSHTYASGGTYHVCLIVYHIDQNHDTLCVNYSCQYVTVPSLATCLSGFVDYLLQGNTWHFYMTATTGDQNWYHWDYGDGTTLSSTLTNPSHTYPGDGVYIACLTSYDIDTQTQDTLCSSTTCDTITIGTNANCVASFGNYFVSGFNYHFYVNATTGDQNWYHWDFGDGTTLDTAYLYPFHTFPHNGTYIVCLTAYDIDTQTQDTLCHATLCDTITIGTIPDCVASFAYYQYQGNTFHFVENATTGDQNSYHWIFGDGTTLDTTGHIAIHTYPGNGTYHVCLIVYDIDPQNGDTLCVNYTCQTITIGSTCVASFAYYFYQGSTIHFVENATTGDQNSYHWIFGDGTTLDTTGHTVVHTYPGNGTYHVCLIVYDIDPQTHDTLCVNYTCHYITIGSTCEASFGYYQYQGNMYHFYVNAQTGDQNWYHWDFGDGSTLDTAYLYPFHTFPGSGVYHVCLTVFDIDPQTHDTLCSDTVCQTITVGPITNCEASFGYYVYQGTTIHFYENATTGDQNTYHWVFGDGTSLDTTGHYAIHTFPGNGTYNICLIVYDIDPQTGDTLCVDYTCQSITIGSNCVADFGFYQYQGLYYHFYVNNQLGDQNSYHWDFGDGTTLDTTYLYPFHHFPGNGTYLVCLTVFDIDPQTHDTLCSDTICHTVTIGPINTCDASFAWYVYQGSTYHFYENAQTGDQNLYLWDFGDGTYSLSNSHYAYHSYTGYGTFIVCLTVFDVDTITHDTLCSDMVCHTLSIYAGIDEPGLAGAFSLYPNPASYYIQIINHTGGDAQVAIYNLLGEAILTKVIIDGSNYVSVAELPAGVYIYRISDGDKIYGSEKLIIVK